MLRKIFVTFWPGVLLVVAATLWPSPASAQVRRGRVLVAGRYFYSPYFYEPFWGPYPYPYYGGYYGTYPVGVGPVADVRVLATPRQAEVYVDGFYAGVVDDFDGTFQRLRTAPGGHAITLHLEGYRTITQNVYVTPGSTFKLQLTMDKLAPGEASEPPPAPASWPDRRPVPRQPITPGT